MIRLILNRIISRKLVSLTIILAFFGIFLLTPLGFQNTKETKLAVENSIAEHGRGTYDILIRPSSSRSNVEKKVGMVEENYIGDSKGGISIKEWEKIKQNPSIEVAAPVASIGYFSGKKLTVEFPKLDDPTRYTFQFYTTDGQKEYPISKTQNLVYFEESIPGYIEYLKVIPGETAVGAIMDVMLPATYHLLSAIDIESEHKLTKVDYSELKKDVNPHDLEMITKNIGEIPIIKVIQREDINIPIMMKLKVDKLDINVSDYREKLGISDQEWLMSANDQNKEDVMAELIKLKAITTSEYNLDLTSFQKPFDGTALKINNDFNVELATDFASDRGETSIYYIAEKLQYNTSEKGLNVSIVENGSPPSYKILKKKGESLYESTPPFLIEQVGTFSPINEKNNLTSSPLGIYATSKIETEQGKILKPTTVPGSFIPQPAGGLITLESAEIIKGAEPIDAIRVRVEGISKYNKEAQQKIEKIATELLRDGYEVDIVAGSSFKNATLEVEGIGKVIAPWTTLGVAQELEESWNGLTFLTTILFATFVLVWFVSRLLFEKGKLEKEDELLTILGWSHERIIRRNYLEQYFLLFIAFILSISFMAILKLEISSYLIASCILIVAILMINIIFSIKRKNLNRVIAYKFSPSLFYHSHIIIPTMSILFTSTILLVIQIASFGNTLFKSQESTLGQFTVDVIFWFQLFILISTFILSTFGLTECLITLFYARRAEFNMYHIIGWTRKRILFHLSKEIFLWATFSICLGLITSYLILLKMGVLINWIIVGILSSGAILFIVVSFVTIVRNLFMQSREN
ncbi:hypothetical protein [Lysinibacillus fusiformis]|uniref:hypothetical protein n=1 Tax=Lysinibacillus fusiformis TaxID=28031 RepID=UPI00215B401A|nr:hypothetical protein [Lysinibacillus fusiformis]MCR8854072.1 hypothetical protein [Lysinibacillus fusiformis]WKT79371.1 hypothetical protein QYY55_11410 [Lysinibacillus fusiformis]